MLLSLLLVKIVEILQIFGYKDSLGGSRIGFELLSVFFGDLTTVMRQWGVMGVGDSKVNWHPQ